MNKISLLCVGLFLTFPFFSAATEEKQTHLAACTEYLEQIRDFSSHVNPVIFFQFDSASLSSRAVEDLEMIAVWLQKHPHIKIVVNGYSDISEATTSNDVVRDKEYAVALAKRRAQAIRFLLTERSGINSDRIRIITHNAERNSDYSDNTYNRRVVIKLEEPDFLNNL